MVELVSLILLFDVLLIALISLFTFVYELFYFSILFTSCA